MGAYILQLGCTIQCPHGGMVSVINTNTRVNVGGNHALLATDAYTIADCPFTISTGPHSWVTMQWQAEAKKVKELASRSYFKIALGCVRLRIKWLRGRQSLPAFKLA